MEDLFSLAVTWMAVFVAHFAAARTRLTPVLWFLAMGCLLVNLGVLPREPGIFMQDFAEIGILSARYCRPAWRLAIRRVSTGQRAG